MPSKKLSSITAGKSDAMVSAVCLGSGGKESGGLGLLALRSGPLLVVESSPRAVEVLSEATWSRWAVSAVAVSAIAKGGESAGKAPTSVPEGPPCCP